MEMSGPEFEAEVRDMARALWGSKPGSGASSLEDGRERDCIFEQEYLTHYIEVTISRKMEKIRSDSSKMEKFREAQARKGRPVKLWIVTYEEPTAEQRTYCKGKGIDILSLIEFRKHIINAQQYMEYRENHSFGSAADPETDSSDISNVRYQAVGIYNEINGLNVNIPEISGMLLDGNQVLLLGDYGMGKSMTIRQIYLSLKEMYFSSNGSSPVPVVLNLREHWGQNDPMEALRRHADLIGFDMPGQLVRAFNAGRLIVLLDGFDEITGSPWTKLETKQLRLLRKNAVQLVFRFVQQARKAKSKIGILIAGREHFFDHRRELVDAFGLLANSIFLNLGEFTDQEASLFLKSQGLSDSLPDWFPKRPLLLATLATRGFIDSILSSAENVEPALAWDRLVDKVCEREAEIHQYLDASSIRRILERLATYARSSVSNVGPVGEDQLAEAFQSEVGSFPDEYARPLLQRLPGLSTRNQQDGKRSFLDDQMLDILRAGKVHEYYLDPWSDPDATKWNHGLAFLGAQLVSEKIGGTTSAQKRIVTAAKEAAVKWGSPTLALDLQLVSQSLAFDKGQADFEGLVVEGGSTDTLDLSNYPAPIGLRLKSCFISELILPDDQIEGLNIEDCIIEKVTGAASEALTPGWVIGCAVSSYDGAMSNARIMEESKQCVPVRVMLIVLRKLYNQKGSGRRENALFRGINAEAQAYVDDVLQILAREKLVFSFKRGNNYVWHPVSGQKRRAFEILDGKGGTTDPAIQQAKELFR